MIISISISNFLSFKEEKTFFLNKGVNLLIGINGSGKSNFLKSIEILFRTVSENAIRNVIAEFGGYEAMKNYAVKESKPIALKFEFDYKSITAINRKTNDTPNPFKSNPFYELEICKFGETSFSINEKVYVVNSDGTNFVYADVKNGFGFVSARDDEQQKIKSERIDTDGTKSIFEEKIDKRYYLMLHNLKNAVSAICIYNQFDFSAESKIRKLAPYTVMKRLLSDGSNLVQVLNNLNVNYIDKFDEFERDFNLVNENYTKVLFQNIAGNNMLSVREKGLNKAVPIARLSDGTLKFILLMSIFLNPDSGFLLCIDEPENNLHPDMIGVIAERIKSTATDKQCFIATHSPLLLNLFDANDLLLFEKGETSGTTMRKGSSAEADELIGNLWLSGKIGAVRW
jgi:predicted ATPase